MSKKEILLHRLAFLFLIISITYLATKGSSIITSGWDKLDHFFAFFLLYTLFYYSFLEISNKYKVMMIISLGFTIEIVQSFLPNRSASILDIVADFVGITAGYIVIAIT